MITHFRYVCHCYEHEHEYDIVVSGSHSYKILELREDRITSITMSPLHTLAEYKPLPHSSSVEGLILLWCPRSQGLFVCNPITCECVRVVIPPAPEDSKNVILFKVVIDPIARKRARVPIPPVERGDVNYGFGVSRESKQYKLVWIIRDHGCQVYTMGTGQWRVGPSPPNIRRKNTCASLGGKLYWVQNWENVCSFDLEREVFATFPAPPCPDGENPNSRRTTKRVCVLEECLCVRDYDEVGIRIWVMRGEEDWSLQFVIPMNKVVRGMNMSLPVKVLGDTILMDNGCGKRYWYNIKTTALQICYFGYFNQDTIACHFKPTIVPLKTLFQQREAIHSF
ncbi:hypothetical protein AAHA92_24894 [Salvia divinorum]|uniref:F-box associated beta-propeller type 1 domain-containing protein n=1 Tax=Salvia divinorum TaxID=28513 RepID=A0ABD1G8U4_SALDI